MFTFDLEFYKPPVDQENYNGINPLRPGHLLLGGVFTMRKYPSMKCKAVLFSHWIWQYQSEKSLVESIWLIFHRYHVLKNDKPQHAIIVGLGISRFDLPNLQALFMKYKVASDEKIVDVTRFATHVDLTTAGALYASSPFLRNISHAKLYQKLFNRESNKENGKIVRSLYEERSFDKIVDRTKMEVKQIEEMYFELSKIPRENCKRDLDRSNDQ